MIFKISQRNNARDFIRDLNNSFVRFFRTLSSNLSVYRSNECNDKGGAIMIMRFEEDCKFCGFCRVIRLGRFPFITSCMGEFSVNQYVALLTICLARGLVLFSVRVGVTRALSTRAMLRYFNCVARNNSRYAYLVAIGVRSRFQTTRLRIRIHRLRDEIIVCFTWGDQWCFLRFFCASDL